MKKLGIVGLLIVFMLPLEASVEAATITTHESSILKPNEVLRKKKGYRKKKGFMWGLFRKNNCGCPKH